ncbi:helix-turn-helix domain-containing protein [Desulfovibrio sp. ZJ200]|uniref:helix-turn-helix domain-containing protein n=1 Tax=Desulfovibrio sp. ZJ200 TaxID=2709792 RepID=UPI0013EC0FE6|nr:helix-turn-helix domain-containing protein [Desulfovibrio sp. ZJ200]
MTLEELGAALRAEREKRGLSIEDVADHLKIGARQLRALEDGDVSSLPHPAYTKGFIRSYSAYLGLAAEEVSEAVKTLNEPDAQAVSQSVYLSDAAWAPRRRYKWLGLLIIAALLGIGAYVAWQQGAFEFLSRQTRRMAQPSPPLPSPDSPDDTQRGARVEPAREPAAQAPARQEAAPAPAAASPSTAPAAVPQSSLPAAPAQVPAQNRQADATQMPLSARERGTGGLAPGANLTPAREAANASSAPAPAQTQGALPAGPHKLIITATEECWVHSNADNTDTRQFSLRKGDTFALTFTKSLELKLGNAGGVRIRYNGEELPAPGQSGQVRTLTFPPAAR